MPPTMQALLAARLDQLEPAERSVLERGAVEGESSTAARCRRSRRRSAGDAPPRRARPQGADPPGQAQLAGEDGFRFRHLLIRDAAYDALPKATRAELHERFAAWLEEHGTELVELDEILGYHLEQALRYRGELGLPDDDELAAAARRPCGRRATRGRAKGLRGRSEPPRASCGVAARRTWSTSRWSSSWHVRSTSRDGVPGGTSAAESLAGAPARGQPSGRARGKLQAAYVLQELEPEGAAESSTPSSSKRCRSSRQQATTTRSTPPTWRAGWWRSSAPRGTQHCEPGSWPPVMHAQPASRTSSWAGVPWPASTERRPSPRCSRGWTRTSLERP